MCEVSVIVPIYNSQEYIVDCLEALLAQTFHDFEILLIDDGSSDCSLSKIKQFQHDTRVKLLKNPNNQGAAAARNMGIRNANGRFIAFCDSDDIWKSNKLEVQLAHMKSTGAAISHTAVLYTTETRQTLVGAKPQVSLSDMKTRNWIPNSSGIHDVSKTGKIYQSTFHHEDYEMWCEAIKRGGPSIGVTEPLVQINRRKDSLSGNKLKSLVWHFKAQRRIFSIGYFEACLLFIKNVTSRIMAKFEV